MTSQADGVAAVLLAAADLIEPEGRWVQVSFASDRHGLEVGVKSPYAVCFCALGAIQRVAQDTVDEGPAYAALKRVVRGPISNWNDADGRTQAEVVAALRAAAASLSPEPDETGASK